MKKVVYNLALGIFVGLVVLYLLAANSVQGFQNAPSNMPTGSSMPANTTLPMIPTTPSNDALITAPSNLMQPTTTPAAMNTATTTIKLSDLQQAKDALNILKAALDNLH
jgi:hypothetical protein